MRDPIEMGEVIATMLRRESESESSFFRKVINWVERRLGRDKGVSGRYVLSPDGKLIGVIVKEHQSKRPSEGSR